MTNSELAVVCLVAFALAGVAGVFACSSDDDDDDCMNEKCDEINDDTGYDDWCLTSEECGPLVSDFHELCPNTVPYAEAYQIVCLDRSNPNCLADCWDMYGVCAQTWECYTSYDCAGYSGDDDCK